MPDWAATGKADDSLHSRQSPLQLQRFAKLLGPRLRTVANRMDAPPDPATEDSAASRNAAALYLSCKFTKPGNSKRISSLTGSISISGAVQKHQIMTGTITFNSAASGAGRVVINTGNLSTGTLTKPTDNSVIITAMRPVANQEYEVSLVPVDIDIVHPATGELSDTKEGTGDGGYVSVQRLEDPAIATSDVTPKTKLIVRTVAGAQATWKTRLKFEKADRYKVYRDEARTQEVISESTELPANTDTTLWFHGLKKSLFRGSESITMQINVNGTWVDGDAVKCTIVQSEFLFQVKAFIPYSWTDAEEEVPGPNNWSPMYGKVAKGDLHPGYGNRPAFPGFRNEFSTDAPAGAAPSYKDFENASFRVCQTLIVTPYEELHTAPDIQAKRKLYTAPSSEHFTKSTSVNAAEVSLHMGFMSLSGTASASGKPPPNTPSYEHLVRSGRISEITIDGGGKDGAMPWGTTWATDDIHWRLYLKVWCDADPLIPKVEFGGKHDSYPAYEIIVIQSDGSFKDIHRASPATGRGLARIHWTQIRPSMWDESTPSRNETSKLPHFRIHFVIGFWQGR